jgi:hypothetical protein
MAILTTDIVYRLSGGAANADPLLSIGGIKSSAASSATIFDDVSSVEAAAGDIEYRLVYIHNAHATLAYQAAAVWIQTQTPSANTDVAIGLAAAGINATETAVANENTAPVGVAFSAPATFGAGLALGSIPAGQHYGVWIRRTINAGAASAADSFTLRVQGDSNP